MRLQSSEEPSSSPAKCESRYSILAPFMKSSGVGAELGVFKGAFVDWLLQTKPKKLYLVDPWYRTGPEWNWAKGEKSTLKAFMAILEAFKFEIQSGQVEPRVELSQEFFSRIEDDSLDWVYIDSTHGYGQTMTELTFSLKKVKPTGYIMGDDYTSDSNHPHYGVYKAVKEMEAAGQIKLIVDGEQRQFVAQRASV